MTPLDLTDESAAKAQRKAHAQQVHAALEAGPLLRAHWNESADRYSYLDSTGTSVRLPKKPGIYALYSVKTGQVLYVAHSDHLKRAVDREVRASGRSEFKDRWLRAWLGLSTERRPTRDESAQIARFIHTEMALRVQVLYFGRAEAAEDLTGAYRLRVGPNAIDPQQVFEGMHNDDLQP